jgi:DNA-binding NtrC family response regulator
MIFAMESLRSAILIADDDDAVRCTFVRIARVERLQVVEASTPEQAMGYVDAVRGALIDGFRRGNTFGGIEVYQACITRGKIAKLCTADWDLQTFLEAQKIDYFRKPLELHDLRAFYQKVLGGAA